MYGLKRRRSLRGLMMNRKVYAVAVNFGPARRKMASLATRVLPCPEREPPDL
jgi:hypothetical protein